MREFFKILFSGLFISGIRQAEFMSQEDISTLFDELCILSEKKFGYIPLEVQKAEIRKQVTEDPDFNSLNTRWLFKVLSRIAGKYWNEKHPEDKKDHTPIVLTEEAKKNIDRLADEFKRSLMNGFTMPVDNKAVHAEMEKIKHEDSVSRENKAVSVGVRSSTAEDIALREQRRLWMLDCFEPTTGRRKDNWIEFEEWMKLKEDAHPSAEEVIETTSEYLNDPKAKLNP